MKKINFVIERVASFFIGLLFLTFLLISNILGLEKNLLWISAGCIIIILCFLFSFSYSLTYDSESLTVCVCFIKRTFQFKDFKNVHVWMYRLYLISCFDSRLIAIPGIGEKKKLFLLFEEIKKKQPSLEILD